MLGLRASEFSKQNESDSNLNHRIVAGPCSCLRLLTGPGDQATTRRAQGQLYHVHLSDASGSRLKASREMSEVWNEAESREG
jgi:hypothetical protein